MSGVVQINPGAPCSHVTAKFRGMLCRHARDFELKYCWLEPEPQVSEARRAIQPEGPEEEQAIREIIALLADGDKVEILFGY